KRSSLHGPRSRESRKVEYSGGNVYIQSHRLEIALTSRQRHPPIDDDERHADAFLVHEPFVGQSAIAKKEPIVCAENDDRVLSEPAFVQFCNESADLTIHARYQAII